MAPTPVLLELDLSHGLLESPPADPLAALRSRHMPVLSTIVETLRKASQAPEVGGLIAHVGPEVLSPAQVEELGAAVEAFGKAGKPTLCWTEAFGETGNGTQAYHLATYFDEIWLQPSGGLGLVGTAAGGLFLRGALDKLGLEPQIHARKEFKNAPDTLLRTSMGDAQREALQRLADSFTDAVVATIARRRSVPETAVRAAIADAPLTPEQALEARLVDAVGYRDEAYVAIRRTLAGAGHEHTDPADLPPVTLKFVQRWNAPRREALRERLEDEALRHLGKALRRKGTGGTVAVVEVEGGIALGRGGGSPLGGPGAGSDTICAALRQAGRDDDVAAVVLRVVSPGGSYVASDAVHREVGRLRDGGKPVVASFGTVAASGGYFVAMGADEILALPSTITGSIGVFAGKVVVREALAKAGVAQETVQAGEQATMWTASRGFDEAQLARLDEWLDEVYDDFTQKAAAGRGLAHADLEPLARGRVWTGVDARERGLVDRLGGLQEAITVAAEKAGTTRDKVRPRRFPDASPLARLRPPQSSESPVAALRPSWLGGTAAPLSVGPEALLAELSGALGLGPAAALRLPGGWSLR